MTTLVALATKDALVLGCDSLGTVTKLMIDPWDLFGEFFEPEEDSRLKVDEDGKPLLKSFQDIYNKSEMVPYNHMTHVSKLFPLDPLPMGVMVTGISSIGNRTIQSLILDFKGKEKVFKRKINYTVNSIARKLLNFIMTYYEPEYSHRTYKPPLELMIGGYDRAKRVPYIYRIFVHRNETRQVFGGEAPFGIAFGGEMDEIQRIVFGTDDKNRENLRNRVNILLDNYHYLLQNYLTEKGISEELPKVDNFGDQLKLFKDWRLTEFNANWGDFSNQNAIECVNWFVGIMIRSHEFSSRLPTVGGKIHLGLITKDNGFAFVSKEAYVHEGHETPMEEIAK